MNRGLGLINYRGKDADFLKVFVLESTPAFPRPGKAPHWENTSLNFREKVITDDNLNWIGQRPFLNTPNKK